MHVCVFVHVCVSVWALAEVAVSLLKVFREQAIDGETLPLLTEEHLLNTMGLKLGPALKIRSQVHTTEWQHTAEVCGVCATPKSKCACMCRLFLRE